MSASRPMTKMESLLGIERAEDCEAEIKVRIHPEDTQDFRKALLKEILDRYVRKSDLRVSDFMTYLEEDEKHYCRRLEINMVGLLYDETKDAYKLKRQ